MTPNDKAPLIAALDPLVRRVRTDVTAMRPAVNITHRMDDRGFVVTADWLANDPRSGSDWRDAYNIPCRVVHGKVKPVYPCGHCGGKGRDPEFPYDHCPKCGKSGGTPKPV